MTPEELDNLEYYKAILRSPDGRNYQLDDSNDDEQGSFHWLVPLDKDGNRTGERRKRLRYRDGADWTPAGDRSKINGPIVWRVTTA